MIYIDTSITLSQLLAEDRIPPERLWKEPLVSSRLLVYEMWVRIHARGLGRSHEEALNDLLRRISFLELEPTVLRKALDPFPIPVRTLDALHLASLEFLRKLGQTVELASYDGRQIEAARRLGIPICAWA